MTVKAIADTGKDLPVEYLDLGWTHRAELHLGVGRVYDVHGICLNQKILLYLVDDDSHTPFWYPAAVFTVIDDRLPQGWHFRIFPEGSLVTAVWGYQQLTDEQHFDALAEGIPDALKVFRAKQKTEQSTS